MKEYKVIIKDEAETHLDEIYDYIAANLSAQIAAQKQTGRIRKAILNLNTLPYKFPCFDVEPYKSRGYRRMNVDNYAV
ncbi:MAG: type II toxin-antitoxin system RelE/ParE family toxin, partial [Oscillospiraceae bacterium]|nr:type II toxin-antitoxin system RelE/ParE family toxin [Oscillospiraceae bacterium]